MQGFASPGCGATRRHAGVEPAAPGYGRKQACVHGLVWDRACGYQLGHMEHHSSSALLVHGHCELGLKLVAGAPLLCPTGAMSSV